MRAASFAEKLLRAVLGKQRAAAAIGDLVEIGCSKGIAWFWLSVSGCLIRTLWRPFLGVVVVMYSTSWALRIFIRAGASIYTSHLPGSAWMPYMTALCGLGALMCGAGFYAAICYGFSDRFTQFAAIFSGLNAAVVFAWWVPGVLPVVAVLFLVSLAFYFSRPDGRSALLIAVSASTATMFTYFSLALALGSYQNPLMHGKPMGDAELRQHPVLMWLGFLMWVVAAVVNAATCSYMHNRTKQRSARVHMLR